MTYGFHGSKVPGLVIALEGELVVEIVDRRQGEDVGEGGQVVGEGGGGLEAVCAVFGEERAALGKGDGGQGRGVEAMVDGERTGEDERRLHLVCSADTPPGQMQITAR